MSWRNVGNTLGSRFDDEGNKGRAIQKKRLPPRYEFTIDQKEKKNAAPPAWDQYYRRLFQMMNTWSRFVVAECRAQQDTAKSKGARN